jgi:T5SS/PEP-CTERM-associated repeat protein
MNRTFRTRRAVTLLAAATVCSALTTGADGQTWLNPNSGSWSGASNWIGGLVPVPSTSTQLTFNASDAQSYTAFNDIADPFTLNAINVSAIGNSEVGLTGQQLLFAGAGRSINFAGAGGAVMISNPIQLQSVGGQDMTTVAGTGNGTLFLSGALSSSLAPTATGGGMLNLDAPNLTTVLSGGANLYSIRANRGNLVLNGGVYNLTSTQRENDQLGTSVGFWSLDFNAQSNGVASFTMNGGTITAAQGFFSVGTNSVTTASFTNGAFADFSYGTSDTTRGRFGFLQSGTLNVTGGSVIRCRLFDASRNDWAQTQTINIDGPGSRVEASAQFTLPRATATATMAITNGGAVSVTGNAWNAVTPEYLGDPVPNFATVVVSGAGSRYDATGQQLWGYGSGQGTLILGAGGVVTSGDSILGDPGFTGAATLLIQGGTYTNRAKLDVADGLIRITSGTFELTGTGDGTLLNATINGYGLPNSGLEIIGPDSRYLQTGASTLTYVGTGPDGNSFRGRVLVSSGGLMQTGSGGLILSGFEVNATVTGAGSRLQVGTLGTGSGTFEMGQATLGINSGGSMLVAGDSFLSASTFESSVANVQSGTWHTAGQLHIGGQAGLAGGTSTIGVTSGGVISSGGDAFIYRPGTLDVGSGNVPATFRTNGRLGVDGRVSYNSGTITSGGTMSVGGSVVLSSAGSDRSNKKMLEVGGASLTASGLIDLNDNDMLVHADQKAYLTQQIRQARDGGAWDMPGVSSSAARDNPLHNTTLGILRGDEFKQMNGASATFDGHAVADGDTLMKYTYYGDTDFNGKINFDDYVRIDVGFNNHLSGWMNGDFDGNGVVNFDDYVLIDLAFNTQGQTLSRGMEQGGAEVHRDLVSCISGGDATTLRAIPEPTIASLLGCALLAATRPRGSARSRRGAPARRAPR